MTIQQNFQQRPKSYKEFTGTGVLVTEVPTTMCNKLRVVVENVGGGNTILVKGKLFPQTSYQTLATINGATSGVTVDIGVVDEYAIECTAYAASGGTPVVMASAFFNQASGGGGGGTITGASNVGAAGEGVFDAEVGGVLNFRNINAGSNKVTISLDNPNKEIDVDIDETKIDVRNLKNVSPGFNGSFAGWDDTGKLSQVPGYTFDDIGALRVGAQNSLTIPAAVTDYISIGISPTVSNVGLTNLTGVQLNSPVNQPVSNYYGFQVYGYGTNAPGSFTGFLSSPGHSGTSTNITHFSAGGTVNCSGILSGLTINTPSNANDILGVNLVFSGDATNMTGLNFQPSGSYTTTKGISIDLTGASSTNRPVGIEVSEGTFSSTVTFTTTSNLPTLVDSGNILRPVFQVQSGSPITGTDVLMSNLAGFMDIQDDYSGSALGLGAASVGFVSQVAVAAGKTASNVSMLTTGVAVDATSAGGTITDLHLIRGFATNFGGTLTIGTIYGLQIETGISALATTAFGISVEDTGAENYLAKSLKIDGGTKVVSDSTIGLEIGGTKTLRLAVLTTAQRNALPNIAGTMVYDSNTAKGYINDGAGWHQFG